MLLHLTQILRCPQGTLVCGNGNILTPRQNPTVTEIHPRLMWNNWEQEAALPRAEPPWAAGAGAAWGAQQGWVLGLTEPCRQIHGRNSQTSVSLAEEEEGDSRGRKSRKIGVGWCSVQEPSPAVSLCMDTAGDATPKHLPVSHWELQPG